ncbi:MAG TPA: LacI family DNA-binding transcriptional regulator [Candidatus Dormibacteraeota bacterium]|jgi:DNA-binding LacI/PurR family transcriptional regulator|nr:LacI family DNA-binding transcriptional regulator [Candidatus Dormibacteraeota bacterium]
MRPSPASGSTDRADDRRVTIADIAREAEVSTSAVSYALNGRRGVSPRTRERILVLAKDLGWRPHSAARALKAARADAVGLLLAGEEEAFGEEAFFLLRFLAGLEGALAGRGVALVLHTVPDRGAENAVYEQWYAERRVDGMIVLNPVVDDPRLHFLERLGLPAVVVGDTRDTSPLPAVWTDDREAAALAVDHLVALGHTRIARVGGIPELVHSGIRKRGFQEAMRQAGLSPELDIDTDYRIEPATLELLGLREPPTAIIYESEIMAMQGLSVVRDEGLDVPRDISVVAWDDSLYCRLVHPRLTALHRDIFNYGRLAAAHLLDVLDGSPARDLQGTVTELAVRDSTGPPLPD